MCGRISLIYYDEKHVTRPIHNLPVLRPWYNIAPSQDVASVRAGREFAWLKWGLIPSWAKDEKIAYRLINARAETVADKPAFQDSFKKRRCVVLADGFYEW